jgi:undecaprenyl-diphosphatase
MNEKIHNAIHFVKRYKVSQLLLAFILFWTPAILFVSLADEVLEREPILFDAPILQWLNSISSPALDLFFFVFTTMGNAETVVPVTLLILAYLLFKKQYRRSLVLLFSVGGAALANVVLKYFFQRDRPSLWESLLTETSYSFPSGHAMVSCALITCIVLLLWRTSWRVAAIVFGAILIVLIGVSRLYFGVHYPTDVLAGWSVGFLWVLLVTAVAKGISVRSKRSTAQVK